MSNNPTKRPRIIVKFVNETAGTEVWIRMPNGDEHLLHFVTSVHVSAGLEGPPELHMTFIDGFEAEIESDLPRDLIRFVKALPGPSPMSEDD